jgi:hypothetical protein
VIELTNSKPTVGRQTVTIRGIPGFSRSFSSPNEISNSPTSSRPTSSAPALNTVADESRVHAQASRLIEALDLGARPLSLSKNDGAGAAGAVSALQDALDLAAAQSAEEIADLTPPEQRFIKALLHFVETGEPPSRNDYPPELETAEVEVYHDALSENPAEADVFHDAPSDISPRERGEGTGSLAGRETFGGGEPEWRLNQVLELLSRALQNEFTDDHARRAANVANDVLRNVASVGAPTFIRQAVTYAIERGLKEGGASDAARNALGGVAVAVPMLLNLAGLVRDNFAGTATMQSNVGRGLNLTISTCALVVAGATGSLSGMAATLVAQNLVYSGLREAVESALRLRDNANAPNNRSIAAATATTFVTQSVADALMREGASPSGVEAAAQGWPALNDLVRGVINSGTQTGRKQ